MMSDRILVSVATPILVLLLLAPALSALAPRGWDDGPAATVDPPRSVPKDHEEVQRMIFFAVLEGLYRDGVSTEDALLLAAPAENGAGLLSYVYACPICMPAVDALTVYGARAPFPHRKAPRDTFGSGWSEEFRAELRSEEHAVRIGAVQRLTRQYIEARLRSLRLDEEEQRVWTQWLGDLREKGNARLRSYLEQGGPFAESYRGWESCGACEGAAGAMQP